MSVKNFYSLLFIIGLLIKFSFPAWAQRENIWAFAHQVGLDFNSGDPVPITTAIDAFEAMANVCDMNGNLLFYTDGYHIWNRNHQKMPNGNAILPITNFNIQYGVSPTSSTSQGAVIVPFIKDTNRYYVFSIPSAEQPGTYGNLYYTIVDMRLNGGLGDVEPTTRGELLVSGLTEKMTPILGENCNVWLLTCARRSEFHAFEITENGINTTPVVSPMGYVIMGVYGCMDVSEDRKRVAIAEYSNSRGAVVYDFNTQTGEVSTPLRLNVIDGAYDVCFSPNGRLLYVNSGARILQYDLRSNHIDTINPTMKTVGRIGTFSAFKRFTDGRIYYKSIGRYIGAILQPDILGVGCDVKDSVIEFNFGNPSFSSRFGFPNSVPILHTSNESSHQFIQAKFAVNVEVHAQNSTANRYEWENGVLGAYRTITQPGTYWVKYTLPPCAEHVDTFVVELICQMPKFQTLAACKNQSNGKIWVELFNRNGVSYTFTWFDSDDKLLGTGDTLDAISAGKYSVRLQTDNSCDTTILIDLQAINEPLEFLADTLVCQEEAVSFENNSSDFFTEYQWDFGDGTNSSLKNPLKSYDTSGIFQVILIGKAENCTDTLIRTIVVDEPISKIALNVERDSICVGEKVKLTTNSIKTIQSWNWEVNNNIYQEASDTLITWAFDKAGTTNITLKVEPRACPQVTISKQMHVYDVPQVFIGNDTTICFGEQSIILTNIFGYESGAKMLWNTGDTDASLTVLHPGVYTLQVTNNSGCTNLAQITINKDCYIDIPNAFSPNGDGANDYFLPRKILSKGLVKYTMQIFNRWGQLLFETKQIHGLGWDGRFNEQDCVSGVYLYRIVCEYHNGATEEYNGNVTLVR